MLDWLAALGMQVLPNLTASLVWAPLAYAAHRVTRRRHREAMASHESIASQIDAVHERLDRQGVPE